MFVVRRMQLGERAAGAVSEGVRKVKEAAWGAYNKAADTVMGNLDPDLKSRK